MTEGVFKRFRLERKQLAGQTSTTEDLLLARLWITDGRPKKALDLLSTVTFADIDTKRTVGILTGLALERIPDIAGAKLAYLSVLNEVPTLGIANMRLGVLEYLVGDLHASMKYLLRSLQDSQSHSESHFYICIVRRELGPVKEAEMALQLLIESDSRSGYWSNEAYNVLGN